MGSVLAFQRTRCAHLFGGSLRSTFGGLDALIFLAARCARLSTDSLFVAARCARLSQRTRCARLFARRLSADSLRSPFWRLAALDFRWTRCAQLFGSSLRSPFSGLAALMFVAARCARLSADSLRSSFWRLAALDIRRTRCSRLFAIFHMKGHHHIKLRGITPRETHLQVRSSKLFCTIRWHCKHRQLRQR